MSGGSSALLPFTRQSITDALALWSGNGSAVDADRLAELQLPASAAQTVSRLEAAHVISLCYQTP